MIWFWIAWAAMFLAGEGWALFNRTPGDTLSETVWFWLLGYRWAHPFKGAIRGNKLMPIAAMAGTDIGHELPVERKSAWTWRTFAVGLFLAWLFFHLTFGWFTPTHPLPWGR